MVVEQPKMGYILTKDVRIKLSFQAQVKLPMNADVKRGKPAHPTCGNESKEYMAANGGESHF